MCFFRVWKWRCGCLFPTDVYCECVPQQTARDGECRDLVPGEIVEVDRVCDPHQQLPTIENHISRVNERIHFLRNSTNGGYSTTLDSALRDIEEYQERKQALVAELNRRVCLENV